MDPKVLIPSDFVYKGRYRANPQLQGASRIPLCYSSTRDSYFTIGGRNTVGQPLYEIQRPLLPPSLNPTSGAWPQFTLLKDWSADLGGGTAFWATAGINTLADSGFQINGLWFDDVTEHLLFVFGTDTYGFTNPNITMLAVDIYANPVKVHGPWVVNDISPRRGGSQGQAAPAALQALTGRALVSFGFRDSTGQADPSGPAIYSTEKPTRNTPVATLAGSSNLQGPWAGGKLAQSTIVHYDSILQSDTAGQYSEYPYPNSWRWVHRDNPHLTNYNMGPYRLRLEKNRFPANYSFGHGVYIEALGCWGYVFSGQVGPPNDTIIYGAFNEIGLTSNTQQQFFDEKNQATSRFQSIAQFPDVDPSTNPYIWDRQGGARGPHSERMYLAMAIHDPRKVLDAVTSGNTKVQPSTACCIIPQQWPDFIWNNSWIDVNGTGSANQIPGGMVWHPATNELFICVGSAYNTNPARAVINVFELKPQLGTLPAKPTGVRVW